MTTLKKSLKYMNNFMKASDLLYKSETEKKRLSQEQLAQGIKDRSRDILEQFMRRVSFGPGYSELLDMYHKNRANEISALGRIDEEISRAQEALGSYAGSDDEHRARLAGEVAKLKDKKDNAVSLVREKGARTSLVKELLSGMKRTGGSEGFDPTDEILGLGGQVDPSLRDKGSMSATERDKGVVLTGDKWKEGVESMVEAYLDANMTGIRHGDEDSVVSRKRIENIDEMKGELQGDASKEMIEHLYGDRTDPITGSTSNVMRNYYKKLSGSDHNGVSVSSHEHPNANDKGDPLLREQRSTISSLRHVLSSGIREGKSVDELLLGLVDHAGRIRENQKLGYSDAQAEYGPGAIDFATKFAEGSKHLSENTQAIKDILRDTVPNGHHDRDKAIDMFSKEIANKLTAP